jgi:ATP-dependent DNA ligase
MYRRQGIQLAYPFERKRLEKWGFPVIVQPKLDGDRCRAIIDNDGNALLLSSEENQIKSVPHIEDALKESGLRGIELDGELYRHGIPHQQVHGIVGRSKNISRDYDLIEYHIFDIAGAESQAKRTIALNSIEFRSPLVRVPSYICSSFEDVMTVLDNVMEQGYEGIIVRNISYPYMRKRSTGMMKFKPRAEDHYSIVGVEEEISIHGEPKQALGALVLQSDEGHVFKVGSGSFLTRENRQGLWKAREKVVGRVARVKYQHLTERRVPRFPVLIDIV